MADTNQNTRGQFLDDDPFAELTRIMGLDPRPAAPAAPAAETGATPEVEDFGIDLEKELLGELASDEFVATSPEPVAWPESPVSQPATTSSYVEGTQPQEAVSQPEVQSAPEDETAWEDSLDDLLARELLATTETDEEDEPDMVPAEPHVTAQETAVPESSFEEERDTAVQVAPEEVIATAAELYLNDDELWPLENLEHFNVEVPSEEQAEAAAGEETAEPVQAAPVQSDPSPVPGVVAAHESIVTAPEPVGAEASAAVEPDFDFDFGGLESNDDSEAVAEPGEVHSPLDAQAHPFEEEARDDEAASASADFEDDFSFEPFELDLADESVAETPDLEPEISANDETSAAVASDFSFEPAEFESSEKTENAASADASTFEVTAEDIDSDAPAEFSFEPFTLDRADDAALEPIGAAPEVEPVHADAEPRDDFSFDPFEFENEAALGAEPSQAEASQISSAPSAPEDVFPFDAFELDLSDESGGVEREPEPAIAAPASIFPTAPASLRIAPAEPSFEDELTALLNGEDTPAPVVASTTAQPRDSWQPSVHTFGTTQNAETPSAPSYTPATASAERDVEHEELENIFDDFSLDLDDSAQPAEPEPSVDAQWSTAPRTATTPVEEPDFDAIFGDDLDLRINEEPAQPASAPMPSYAPQTGLAAGAVGMAAAASFGSRTQSDNAGFERSPPQAAGGYGSAATAAASQHGFGQSWTAAPAVSKDQAPEIETIEVLEPAPRLVDDLDIPEVEYEAAPPPADPFDAFESEFARSMDQMQDVEHSSQTEAAAQHFDGPTPQELAEEEARWLSAPPMDQQDFDFDNEVDQEVAPAPYIGRRAQSTPRRRGTMLAAAVAGVAAIGVIGVVGATFFGGGSDGPAFVAADGEPIKVRPENPGGTTVPNQNSKVYQSVTGSGETVPGQERLITTSEQPVDVLRQAEAENVLAPGIDDQGADEDVAAVDDGSDELAAIMGQPKSEDRIDPADQSAQSTVAEEVAAVAPRRVRTMVVRPDGTLVPREEVAPAAEAPAQNAATSVMEAPAAGVPLVESANSLSDADAGGVDVETPATVAVVPTPRVEPRPAASQQVAQAPAPAPTPVSAPAAAASAGQASGGWSMQIASQPTVEGAQAAYQDLARRYGSVLQGRGVDIVRADIEGRGTYYRVRIPATSRDEAIQLCTRYKSAGGNCFVSR